MKRLPVTQGKIDLLTDLWRISRTALDNPSRYDRMQYVSREYRKMHPEVYAKQLWLDITDLFRGYGQ